MPTTAFCTSGQPDSSQSATSCWCSYIVWLTSSLVSWGIFCLLYEVTLSGSFEKRLFVMVRTSFYLPRVLDFHMKVNSRVTPYSQHCFWVTFWAGYNSPSEFISIQIPESHTILGRPIKKVSLIERLDVTVFVMCCSVILKIEIPFKALWFLITDRQLCSPFLPRNFCGRNGWEHITHNKFFFIQIIILNKR